MKKKGFTLIELLAIIVILTIILAIAVPSISNVINKSSRSAFESDAKLVLKAAEYKALENTSFNPTDVNKDNINDLLGLSNQNYNDINIIKKNNNYEIIIVGSAKWNGLIACGTFKNMKIVENVSDCNSNMVPPVITILGGNSIEIYVGETYTDSGATAIDDIDGDITSYIQVTSNLNLTIPGTYTITYNVSDSAGNAASPVTREVTVIGLDPRYNVAKGVNSPTLAPGMTPIKWDGTSWVDTTESDTDWYNYTTTDKKWANARTVDGSMWVWIPRYIYKISSGWHTNTAGTIDIQFSKGLDDNWNSSVIGNIDTGTTSNASNNKWTNHPAFTFNSTELTGIWVAKFEATASEGVANVNEDPSGQCLIVGDSVTTKTVKILPNVRSWRCIPIGYAFTAIRNMEASLVYGWNIASTLKADGTYTTDANNIDTHLMKNIEWGAIAYLSKSAYGKNTEEVYTNNNQNYITGCAGNTASASKYNGCQNTYESVGGVKASTTGNIYGIYDLVGGAYENTSAYINNGDTDLSWGSSIINADNKYKDVYAVGSPDNSTNNYALTINKKGDALYETSNNTGDSSSWFNDWSTMASTFRPWLGRGGDVGSDTGAGMFNFLLTPGENHTAVGFRPVLLANSGL